MLTSPVHVWAGSPRQSPTQSPLPRQLRQPRELQRRCVPDPGTPMNSDRPPSSASNRHSSSRPVSSPRLQASQASTHVQPCSSQAFRAVMPDKLTPQLCCQCWACQRPVAACWTMCRHSQTPSFLAARWKPVSSVQPAFCKRSHQLLRWPTTSSCAAGAATCSQCWRPCCCCRCFSCCHAASAGGVAELLRLLILLVHQQQSKHRQRSRCLQPVPVAAPFGLQHICTVLAGAAAHPKQPLDYDACGGAQ